MPTIGATVLTLVDWAKRQDPNDKTARIIEMLSQTNAIINDAPMLEGNLPVGHRTTVRTQLPTVGRRRLNQGVTPSKSTTKQSDEQAAIYEAWSEVDVDLADLGGDVAGFRLSESSAFLEGMNQAMAASVFYGNAGVDQTNFTGFAPRYPASTGFVTSPNVILGNGTPAGSDQTSIWLVGWGPNSVHMFYPRGSTVGLTHQDLGIETAETTAGIGQTRMRVYRDRYVWKAGLAVRDWRYVVRIANVDTSNLVANTNPPTPDLITLMSRAIDRIPSIGACRPVFYMSRTPQSWLRVQALAKSTNAIAVEPALNQFGQRLGDLSFLGIPIRTCDQILETEAILS
jgi:hypothetical protein